MSRLTSLLVLLQLSLLGMAQNTYSLTGYDTYFVPDTLYIEAGDTIQFTSVGYHSATEVDSIDWVNNTANHNGGFWVGFGASTLDMKFTIDNPGTYYNICQPHASMGMKSIIIVSPTILKVDTKELKNEEFFFPNPSTRSITIQDSKTIKIYNLTGQLLLQRTDLTLSENVDISILPKGEYIVVLDSGKQKLIVE